MMNIIWIIVDMFFCWLNVGFAITEYKNGHHFRCAFDVMLAILMTIAAAKQYFTL